MARRRRVRHRLVRGLGAAVQRAARRALDGRRVRVLRAAGCCGDAKAGPRGHVRVRRRDVRRVRRGVGEDVLRGRRLGRRLPGEEPRRRDVSRRAARARCSFSLRQSVRQSGERRGRRRGGHDRVKKHDANKVSAASLDAPEPGGSGRGGVPGEPRGGGAAFARRRRERGGRPSTEAPVFDRRARSTSAARPAAFGPDRDRAQGGRARGARERARALARASATRRTQPSRTSQTTSQTKPKVG